MMPPTDLRRQRSILTNARNHVGRDVVINLDLKDFFPSLTYARVKGLFEALGYAEAVGDPAGTALYRAAWSTKIALDGERHFVADGPRLLPQGAPTSPAITNLICRKLDRRLVGLCARTSALPTAATPTIMTFSASGEAARRSARCSRPCTASSRPRGSISIRTRRA